MGPRASRSSAMAGRRLPQFERQEFAYWHFALRREKASAGPSDEVIFLTRPWMGTLLITSLFGGVHATPEK